MKHKQVWIRPMRQTEEEIVMFRDWMIANRDKNKFDPDIFRYPSTKVLVAFNEDGIVEFIPVLNIWMWGPLAPNPNASEGDKAQALRAAMVYTVANSYAAGVGEMWFGAEPLTAKFADNHGWKPVEVPMYCLKVSDLEKSNEEKEQ